MKVDLARSLRRIRPATFTGAIARRPNDELPFAADAPLAGPPLLLDTSVYIDALEGTTPPEVDALIETRSIFHVGVAVGEFCHNFGRLSPTHPGTAQILQDLQEVVEMIPRHRLEAPTTGVLVEAGILAGLLFRLGNLAKGQEVSAFNDAAIYLHGLERGYTVLTRNVKDFDFLNQIIPTGRILLYERVP